MPEDNIEEKSIGTFLRQERLAKRIELEQVAEDTKISLKTLRAIEADDCKSLPAPAFSRGFYEIYAKFLCIAPEDIPKFHNNNIAPDKEKSTYTSDKSNYTVEMLAERPPIPLIPILGFTLLLSMIVFGIIAWYFSWNPAEYLSKQLRTVNVENITPMNNEEQLANGNNNEVLIPVVTSQINNTNTSNTEISSTSSSTNTDTESQ
ncbi:MAG: helix-turn-helix domain-containing protein [Desulfotalea sp.]